MYQNCANNNVLAGGGGGANYGKTTSNANAQIMDSNQQSPHQQTIDYSGIQPQQQAPVNNNKSVRKKPYVKITEQPASKALRFRYECEARSAGSILGANSTPECKTYPTIEIVGYKGRAVVVVSCVTKDPPYRPHPHNLVGKEGCKKGVCTIEINSETMRAVFSNLGIQCVKKKDIEAALKAREEIRVDPFKTGFMHRYQPSSIELNSVRLCFQVFMESDQKGRFTQPLAPVVSEPIFDKKAISDLVICRLSSRSASVLGNTRIILLCEKVANKDISVRFYEENNGQTIWEAYGDFKQTDVHKQTAITFKTPRYHKIDITEPAKVFIQLKRPSDGVTSNPLPFKYVPLNRIRFLDLRSKLEKQPDSEIFQEIHSSDIENYIPNDKVEINDLNTTSDSAHLRRKRPKTNDDSGELLLQQQQKQHKNDHQDCHLSNWNSSNIPMIKTEARVTSPQTFGICRVPPELTPSPQHLSPSSAYTHNTPSPYNITPTMMSPNNQYNANSVGPNGINNVNCSNSPPQVDIGAYNGFCQQPQQQQMQQQQYHGSTGTAHWETKFNSVAAATSNNSNNLTNENAFTMHSLLTPSTANVDLTNGTDGARNNWPHQLRSNHFHSQHNPLQLRQQQHQQYQQQKTTNDVMITTNNTAVGVNNNINGNNENNNNKNNTNNNNNGHGLSNLLTLDSRELVHMNSEEQQMVQLNPEDLQISNLSIST